MKNWPTVKVASCITGTGFAVPKRVVPNSHFETYLETNDQWIRERTGIAERRWVSEGETVSSLAAEACKQALEQAGLKATDIDGIIFATVTPDFVFPSAACVLQQRLGIPGCLAFDVSAACSGFVYALELADSLVARGKCKNIIVAGGDIFSRLIDHKDRGTAILFGDGAGVAIVSAAGKEGEFVSGSSESLRGVYTSELHADGAGGPLLYVPSVREAMGEATNLQEAVLKSECYLSMAGRDVFKLAVRALGEVSESVLAKAGISASDVDWFVSHQANQRILDAMAKHLGIADEKVLSNIASYGNTSAGTVPILLAESVANGTIKRGDLVMLSAFGGGLTWGAMLVRW